MILLNIFDIKETMAHLLIRESFDSFLLEEVSITTFAKMEMQGWRNRDWFEQDDTETELPDHLYWKEAKPFCYSYIKGKKTPAFFTVSLKLTENELQTVIPGSFLFQMMKEQQTDVLLHFRYEKDVLSVVSGTSAHVFTMDKSIEFAWDSEVKAMLKKLGIGFE